MTLASFIQPCHYLADVGCDHGYLSEIALDNNLCDRVCITDISQKSLNKAINRLSRFSSERVFAIATDGLENVPPTCDQVIIAGMGGEEIVKILTRSSFLPKRLILSPMKNSDKVRRIIDGLGYKICDDTIFFDGVKYYFVITAVLLSAVNDYSDLEFEYGRQSMKSQILVDYLQNKIDNMLKNSDGSSDGQKRKIEALEDIQNEIRRNL